MNIVIAIFFGIAISLLVSFFVKHLGRIAKHLQIIRLQLEIQNPMFVSEELLELDKNIKYWRTKMWKYKDDIHEKNKEIGKLTFDLFWQHVERLNQFRVMIVEAKKNGNTDKIHKKYESWLDKNKEDIEKTERKARGINSQIKKDLEKRDLDIEFLGKWDIDIKED